MFEKLAYEYSSTQFNLPEDISKDLRTFSKQYIDDSILYEDEKDNDKGREDEFHVSILYGIDPKEDRNILKSFPSKFLDKPPKIKLGKIAKFRNDKYDVIKLDVEGADELEEMWKYIYNNFENHSKFSTYKPHITLAYVNPGECEDLVNDSTFEGKEIVLKKFKYSPKEGEPTFISLGMNKRTAKVILTLSELEDLKNYLIDKLYTVQNRYEIHNIYNYPDLVNWMIRNAKNQTDLLKISFKKTALYETGMIDPLGDYHQIGVYNEPNPDMETHDEWAQDNYDKSIMDLIREGWIRFTFNDNVYNFSIANNSSFTAIDNFLLNHLDKNFKYILVDSLINNYNDKFSSYLITKDDYYRADMNIKSAVETYNKYAKIGPAQVEMQNYKGDLLKVPEHQSLQESEPAKTNVTNEHELTMYPKKGEKKKYEVLLPDATTLKKVLDLIKKLQYHKFNFKLENTKMIFEDMHQFEDMKQLLDTQGIMSLNKVALTEDSKNKYKQLSLELNKVYQEGVDKNWPPEVEAKYDELKKQMDNLYTDKLDKQAEIAEKDGNQVASIAVMTDGEILMGKRNDNGKWTLPGGHAKQGENPIENAIRELKEETGIETTQADLMYLGQDTVDAEGKQLIINCFLLNQKEKTNTSHDPDEEVEEWKYIDIQTGKLPREILDNLHSNPNITLGLLGLQEVKTKKSMKKKSELDEFGDEIIKKWDNVDEKDKGINNWVLVKRKKEDNYLLYSEPYFYGVFLKQGEPAEQGYEGTISYVPQNVFEEAKQLTKTSMKKKSFMDINNMDSEIESLLKDKDSEGLIYDRNQEKQILEKIYSLISPKGWNIIKSYLLSHNYTYATIIQLTELANYLKNPEKISNTAFSLSEMRKNRILNKLFETGDLHKEPNQEDNDFFEQKMRESYSKKLIEAAKDIDPEFIRVSQANLTNVIDYMGYLDAADYKKRTGKNASDLIGKLFDLGEYKTMNTEASYKASELEDNDEVIINPDEFEPLDEYVSNNYGVEKQMTFGKKTADYYKNEYIIIYENGTKKDINENTLRHNYGNYEDINNSDIDLNEWLDNEPENGDIFYGDGIKVTKNNLDKKAKLDSLDEIFDIPVAKTVSNFEKQSQKLDKELSQPLYLLIKKNKYNDEIFVKKASYNKNELESIAFQKEELDVVEVPDGTEVNMGFVNDKLKEVIKDKVSQLKKKSSLYKTYNDMVWEALENGSEEDIENTLKWADMQLGTDHYSQYMELKSTFKREKFSTPHPYSKINHSIYNALRQRDKENGTEWVEEEDTDLLESNKSKEMGFFNSKHDNTSERAREDREDNNMKFFNSEHNNTSKQGLKITAFKMKKKSFMDIDNMDSEIESLLMLEDNDFWGETEGPFNPEKEEAKQALTQLYSFLSFEGWKSVKKFIREKGKRGGWGEVVSLAEDLENLENPTVIKRLRSRSSHPLLRDLIETGDLSVLSNKSETSKQGLKIKKAENNVPQKYNVGDYAVRIQGEHINDIKWEIFDADENGLAEATKKVEEYKGKYTGNGYNQMDADLYKITSPEGNLEFIPANSKQGLKIKTSIQTPSGMVVETEEIEPDLAAALPEDVQENQVEEVKEPNEPLEIETLFEPDKPKANIFPQINSEQSQDNIIAQLTEQVIERYPYDLVYSSIWETAQNTNLGSLPKDKLVPILNGVATKLGLQYCTWEDFMPADVTLDSLTVSLTGNEAQPSVSDEEFNLADYGNENFDNKAPGLFSIDRIIDERMKMFVNLGNIIQESTDVIVNSLQNVQKQASVEHYKLSGVHSKVSNRSGQLVEGRLTYSIRLSSLQNRKLEKTIEVDLPVRGQKVQNPVEFKYANETYPLESYYIATVLEHV